MAATDSPPRKRRKLADEDDEYIPSDQDNGSDYVPSDNEEKIIPSKKQDIDQESEDEDMDLNEDGSEGDDEQSEEQKNDEGDDKPNPWENIPIQQKREFYTLRDQIKTFTSSQLKSVIKHLKGLRAIDGEAPMEHLSMTGKKEHLQVKINKLLASIYINKLIVEDPKNWWRKYKVYNETIDFDGWKSQIKQQISLISAQSSKGSKSRYSSLLTRLNACDKSQIIAAITSVLNEESDGSELASKLESKLPKPSLDGIFKRHDVLIKAISKARPWTRYGSSGDNYCFKRCRSSINTAKKAILDDGKTVIASKEWDTCLEYLVVTMNNIRKFPTWDDHKNNAAKRDLKKKLKIWYEKVRKGLEKGGSVNDIQMKRLEQLANYVN